MAGVRGHSGQTCAVHECYNNWKKLRIWKESECEIHHSPHAECPCIKPYSLHRFPGRKGEEDKKRQWVKNINRKGFEPNSHSVVCTNFLYFVFFVNEVLVLVSKLPCKNCKQTRTKHRFIGSSHVYYYLIT